MFTKEERSSFPYWFAHWCAFQMTALNHRMWRPKYLFHDIEKPWLRLLFPYKKVQKWHRFNSKHHLEWLDNKLGKCKGNIRDILDRYDWKATMIDWECSRFTKVSSPVGAREKVKEIFTIKGLSAYPNIIPWWEPVKERIDEVLDKYDF